MPYAPAGMLTTSGGLTHQPAAFYKRTALDQLMKKFIFMSVAEPDNIPLREGKTIQWYRVDLPSANTTASSEGAVSTSLAYSTAPITATVSEYSDFITASTLLVEVDIAPTVENMSKWLGYRAGLSVDTIVRIELDSPSTTVQLATLGTALTAADLGQARMFLKGADVMGREMNGDEFVAIMHPYVEYDLMSDNSAGGWIDAKKYTTPEDIINGEVGKIAGCRCLESTNVATSGTAPAVLYSTYVVGANAIGAVNLSGRGPSKVVDPRKSAFKTNVIMGKPQMADPEGKIGAAVSYRFVFTAKLLDTNVYRYFIIPADASLV